MSSELMEGCGLSGRDRRSQLATSKGRAPRAVSVDIRECRGLMINNG